MPLDHSILGQGVYSPRQAARILGGSPQEVLRWTRGSGTSDPLWKAHYQFLDDTPEISFLDLVELRVVRELRAREISLQSIRYSINLAREKFGVEHPLSTLKFKTDGVEILIDAVENDGEYVSLSKAHPTQKVFADIVSRSVSDLHYEDGRVASWRPSAGGHVVLDPKRAFGEPIVDKFGVSTRVIYAEWERSRDAKSVARLYELDLAGVKDAISYESKLDDALKADRGQGLI